MENISELEFTNILLSAEFHINNLLNIIQQCGESLEGNCFYRHGTTERLAELRNKQRNLCTIGRNSKHIFEIGFNAGHSTLLFLLSNPSLLVDCVDICYHSYTIPCFQYLEKQFPGRIRLMKGDAVLTLEKIIQNDNYPWYDTFHIDGPHDTNLSHLLFLQCRKMIKQKQTVVIWDDIDIPGLGKLWEEYTQLKMVSPISLLPVDVYPHAIGYYC